MSTDGYVVHSGPINLPASKLATLAINMAAGRRGTLTAVKISFSAASTINVDCRLSRVTNTPAGTAIPANWGPNPLDPASQASQATALTASTANPGVWTTPPTEGAVLDEFSLPSTAGPWVEYPLTGQEWAVAASAWAAFFCTAAATGVVAYTSFKYTE
jgi:hypothetical protein